MKLLAPRPTKVNFEGFVELRFRFDVRNFMFIQEFREI